MAEIMVTVRLEVGKLNMREWGKTYRIIYNSNVYYIPIKSVEKKYNGRFVDLEMPKWMAQQKELTDYVVAEY